VTSAGSRGDPRKFPHTGRDTPMNIRPLGPDGSCTRSDDPGPEHAIRRVRPRPNLFGALSLGRAAPGPDPDAAARDHPGILGSGQTDALCTADGSCRAGWADLGDARRHPEHGDDDLPDSDAGPGLPGAPEVIMARQATGRETQTWSCSRWMRRAPGSRSRFPGFQGPRPPGPQSSPPPSRPRRTAPGRSYPA